MKAIVHERYGSPHLLELREVAEPVVAADTVLVRVRACSVNPVDWHGITGVPFIVRLGGSGLRRPKSEQAGVDFAGTVEAVGEDVTQFQVGDEVFGSRIGAFAELVAVPEERAIVPKPGNLTFEQAAAVPVAGLTALQGLRDKGGLRPGQNVLINGASGGVGTFAVQIAKALGAEVTGVCSTEKVELVRSLGADRVVDYTQEDFTLDGERYDLVLDIVGNRAWSELRRVLSPEATLVIVSGPKKNRLLGPLGYVLKVLLAARRAPQTASWFITDMNKQDLLVIKDLIEAGEVTPAVERSYELSEVPEALAYIGEGHCRAKLVVTI